MAINTILFDLDGTLVNTNELIIASFTHTLEQYYHGQYGREEIIGFIGEPLEESFEKVDSKRVDELTNVYRKHNVAFHDKLVREFDGVYETVETLKKQGYQIGVVTTKFRETVNKGLKLARLEPFFETVVTLDDVENAKPDPEPIRLALQLLDAKPEQTIMVGDSIFDIQAGKNAGTSTAGVAWSIKGENVLQAENPDFMLKKMPDLLNILGVHVR